MLYLVTGANGTGKTVLTLKDAYDLAVKENRPVCYNGRFDLVEDGPLRNWKKIDIKDWQAEPDGTIFFVDECHNDFPLRPNGAPVPEYVRMLAEHRRRGFDFFLLTQHPQNIDNFVRRLIGNPGYHRHLKRLGGSQLVSRLHWDAVNPQCERPGSGASGQVTTVSLPKEVFAWYRSASLHTAKVRIPRAVWVLLACAVVVPALGYVGWHTLHKSVVPAAQLARAGQAGPVGTGAPGAEPARKAMTAAEYVASRAARLPGMPYTAPAYDKVTEPTVAPYPAMCVLHQASGKCDCYTQQATRLATPVDVCAQIARYGIFVDWRQDAAAGGSAPRASVPAAAPVAVVSAPPARGGVALAPGTPASAAPVVSYGGEVPLNAVDDYALDLARTAQARREWEARPVASPILLLGERP